MKAGDVLKYLRDLKIRMQWVEGEEKWYLVVMDVIRIVGGSRNPRAYWRHLKRRLKQEGILNGWQFIQLEKRPGRYGKMLVMDLVLFFRVIQFFRSSEAICIQKWLAVAGEEQVRELYDPERALERALDSWRKMGRKEQWILQRVMSQESRHRLTAYWGTHGITDSEEFRALTNLIHQAWSHMSVQEHKTLKGLKSQNLRDHMTESELIFMALAEMTARLVAESRNARGLEENMVSALKAGAVTGRARKDLEEEIGRDIISADNFLEKRERDNR